MRKILLLLSLLLSSVTVTALFWPSFSAAQQIRQLPVNGKRGVTGNQLPLPQVTISRTTFQLAPGGLIFDTSNRTMVHGSLPVGADVWYQLNGGGQIQRLYILRPDEQARLDQAK
jgi:hypothetical protein